MIRQSNSPAGSVNREDLPEYTGNYLGIVVQNNDPEQRGRIKIYVPHINSQVYHGWDNKLTDKSFKFIGRNINSDLSDIIDDLKQILPWADCAAPIAGGIGSGRYNAHLDHGTISDSSKLTHTIPTSGIQAAGKYNLNADQIGEKPARKYEIHNYENSSNEAVNIELTDAFSNTLSGSKYVNKFSSQYKPSSYSNSPKGMFSVPNVGSHVWVFFEGGNPNAPVYFASAYGKEDWKLINGNDDDTGADDYPGKYENYSKGDEAYYDHNVETYRNKFVFNQKGGTLEIVNSDTKEVLKLTHFSGSFKEFNNDATIELATNNDQKLVLGDSFQTVKGHSNTYTERDSQELIKGDSYKKIGTFNKSVFDEWEERVEVFANIKQLFEVKRTNYSENVIIQKVTQDPGMKVEGTYAPCPLCTGNKTTLWDINNQGPTSISSTIDTIVPVTSLGVKIIGGTFSPTFTFGYADVGPSNFLGDGECPVCKGSGLSPSTFEGTFDTNDKDSLYDKTVQDLISDLALIEKKLGRGGDEIVNVGKHKVETIGQLFNKFPSIRVDEVGKIVNDRMMVFKEGVVPTYSTVPLIEYVHVDDMPGGTYSLNVCNRYNVQVGAGGISLKSYGPVDIGGTITNIAGEQINIASENEVNIVGGKRVSISSEILSLRQSNGGQVYVDGDLGIKHNVIVGGGLHVEGELTCHHITAPLEVHETHLTKAYGQLVGGTLIGYAQVGGGSSAGMHPVFAQPTPMSLHTYEHKHTFNSIPMSYTTSSDGVRNFAKRLNDQKAPVPPVPAISTVQKGDGFFDTGADI